MNSMQLKDKLKTISVEKEVDFNTLLRLYVYDRFIERLAKTKYKDNIILKGGFYLSTLFGIENRSTIDIDTVIRNTLFTKENIVLMIKNICNTEVLDDVILEIGDIKDIREEDLYGGYRVNVIFKLENIKDSFHIDVATGDSIVPKAIIYNYKPLLSDKSLNVYAYSIETQLAEKLETILRRSETTSRMKDYYDLYLIYIHKFSDIDKEVLRKAVETTFKKRKYNGDLVKTISILKTSSRIERMWNTYSLKNKFAKNIAYMQIISCLEDIVNVTILVEV